METTPRPTYEEAGVAAATDQGLDPIIARLTAEGITHEVRQTGGFVMNVEVALPGVDDEHHFAITAAAEYGDADDARWVIGEYDADGWIDEREQLVTADEAVEIIRVALGPIPAVLAEYDVIVRRNAASDTFGYDVLAAVATDEDGLFGVFGEVTDTASELGHDVEADGWDPLFDHVKAYQWFLAVEIGPERCAKAAR